MFLKSERSCYAYETLGSFSFLFFFFGIFFRAYLAETERRRIFIYETSLDCAFTTSTDHVTGPGPSCHGLENLTRGNQHSAIGGLEKKRRKKISNLNLRERIRGRERREKSGCERRAGALAVFATISTTSSTAEVGREGETRAAPTKAKEGEEEGRAGAGAGAGAGGKKKERKKNKMKNLVHVQQSRSFGGAGALYNNPRCARDGATSSSTSSIPLSNGMRKDANILRGHPRLVACTCAGNNSPTPFGRRDEESTKTDAVRVRFKIQYRAHSRYVHKAQGRLGRLSRSLLSQLIFFFLFFLVSDIFLVTTSIFVLFLSFYLCVYAHLLWYHRQTIAVAGSMSPLGWSFLSIARNPLVWDEGDWWSIEVSIISSYQKLLLLLFSSIPLLRFQGHRMYQHRKGHGSLVVQMGNEWTSLTFCFSWTFREVRMCNTSMSY